MKTITKFQTWLQNKFKNKKTVLWTLLVIILAGTVLRTYKHHDWLYFDDDQANDFIKATKYLNGETGWPLLGPDMGNTDFHLGPIINHFQIISIKIFGFSPSVMAYPEVFFSILTIPLFYLFLKKIFSTNLSLSFTGLYAISYFALKFSRFAWNTNTMPFFILLFLLAISEFLNKRANAGWMWVIGAGIALGVGVQLHAMLLVIFPVMFLGAIILTAKADRQIWLKWAAALGIALLLNGSQIYFDLTNNFQNTRAFFEASGDRGGKSANAFLRTAVEDAACHTQANIFMLTTWGDKDNCNFLDTNRQKNGSDRLEAVEKPFFGLFILFCAIFSAAGYAFFFRNLQHEKDRAKKYLLNVTAVYLLLFFVIMLPSIEDAPLRYFLPVFFVPYLLLGFILLGLRQKFPQFFFPATAVVILLIAVSNVFYLSTIALELQKGERSGTDDVILGEIEPMKDYIIQESSPLKKAYVTSGKNYIFRFYKPISVLAEREGFETLRVGNKDLEPGIPVFYLYKSYPKKGLDEIKGMEIIDYKNFGGMAVYKVIKNDNNE